MGDVATCEGKAYSCRAYVSPGADKVLSQADKVCSRADEVYSLTDNLFALANGV